MKRVMQFAFGLVLVMGLVANLMPAAASCGGARAVTSVVGATATNFFTPGNPFTPTGNYPVTPYGGSTTYYTNGIFWSFGGGNPAYGLGNDSGYFKGESVVLGPTTWLGGGYNGGFPLFLGGPFGHWQIPGVDGCIDLDGSNAAGADAQECNVVLLTDEANTTGYFAALSVAPNAGADFVYNSSTGFPAVIDMAPIPKPTILNSVTVGNTINITATVVTAPVPANGFYFQCQAANLLLGYKIYARQFPGHNTPKPIQVNTREIDQTFGPPLAPWIPKTPNLIPVGQPANFQLDCAASGDTDFYLCSTLLFGGTAPGAAPFEMKSCSMNSTKVECGPNMANPEPSELRRIERGSDATTPKKPGTRSGR